MTVQDSAQALIDRLKARLEQQPGDAPGLRFDADYAIEDEGGYGDVEADERPDFIRQDDIGWQKLLSFRR